MSCFALATSALTRKAIRVAMGTRLSRLSARDCGIPRQPLPPADFPTPTNAYRPHSPSVRLAPALCQHETRKRWKNIARPPTPARKRERLREPTQCHSPLSLPPPTATPFLPLFLAPTHFRPRPLLQLPPASFPLCAAAAGGVARKLNPAQPPAQARAEAAARSLTQSP